MKTVKTILLIIAALLCPIALLHYSRFINASSGDDAVLFFVGFLCEAFVVHVLITNEKIKF